MSVCSVDVAMLTPDPDQYFLFHAATALSRHPRDIPCEGWDMTGMFNCQHISISGNARLLASKFIGRRLPLSYP